jgi:UDP-N-acetylglucosamine 4,6-dehydratase/5-epimerase
VIDLNGATILLTGGTGSFGNAFIERITTTWPAAVVRVYSRDELKQSELRTKFGDRQVRYLIGDVRDRSRMTRAVQGADIIVHAAAMKQVEACEYNPFEAVRTNVLGAQHVVDAAIDAGVPRVVALSTDKAVNPVNLYGATKLCQEKIIVQGNAYAAQRDTRFACVRYGNVVVLHALENMNGGEVFIPKIPSMRVVDLADAIAPDVPRDVIGIRPGEKLHELMITADESRHAIDAGSTYVVLPEQTWWDEKGPGTIGEPLRDGFVYASDTNDQWLTVPELRAMLGEVEPALA